MPQRKPPMPDLSQEQFRALVEAGLVPLRRYLEICAARGWKPAV
ncbi:hypothetical protein F8B43_0074 [Methylorubrum populi]|uniref:Uncharacterized protein n=1 Tax=Methylorubrum populi TaxID=223967 RepID=A0A833N4C9_9HYPH|nr:hypothetical protein F8B43_0074 [Methylorubrum populi]